MMLRMPHQALWFLSLRPFAKGGVPRSEILPKVSNRASKNRVKTTCTSSLLEKYKDTWLTDTYFPAYRQAISN